MVSDNLLKGLSQGSNPTAQAFDARAQQLDQKRAAEQKAALDEQTRKDAEMLKVFEFAGDGYVDEARYFAQQKGIQVPDEVFSNAELAKGLSMAGKIYGDDAAAAQKFTMAWMSTQGDLNARLAAGQQAAGVPVNSEDRQLQRQIALEQWKLKNRPSSEKRDIRSINNRLVEVMEDGTTRYLTEAPPDEGRAGFVGDVYSAAAGGFNPDTAVDEANRAAQFYDQMMRGGTAAPAPTGPGAGVAPTAAAPVVNNSRAVYAVQQALVEGYAPQDIIASLMQRGMPQDQATQMVNSAGGAQ